MIRNDNEKDLVCHYLYGIVILSGSKEGLENVYCHLNDL